MMQTPAEYRAEHKAVQASIGRLHGQIWRLDGDATRARPLRDEIEACTRRLRTIEYLLCWLEKNAGSP